MPTHRSFELGFNRVLETLWWRGLVAPKFDRLLHSDFELVHGSGISVSGSNKERAWPDHVSSKQGTWTRTLVAVGRTLRD